MTGIQLTAAAAAASGGTPDDNTVTSAKIVDGAIVNADVNAAAGIVASKLSGVAPSDATYIVQTANSTLSAEQAMGALATGILKSTTATGVLSIATAGTDYYNPGGTDVAVADGGTGASTAALALAGLGVPFIKICGTTLGSAAATLDTNTELGGNIPATYSHLELWFVGQTSNAATQVINMTFNADSGSNYDWTALDVEAAAPAPAGSEGIAAAFMAMGVLPPSTATGSPGSGRVSIPFYAGTTFHKQARGDGGADLGTATTNNRLRANFGRWRNTAAITRITLTPAAGNWVTGSAYTLYGIL